MKGRIPQHFIDEMLARVDIVEVVDRRVPLKKAGRNFSALCPFHDEKTPSFTVNQEKQFYYCFGCGAGGNAIGFLMEYERQDFPQAVEALATQAGLEVPREQAGSPQQAARRQDIHALMQQAADFYRRQLREHPQAQRAIDYLKARGLSGEIARAFNIGFAPPGWDNLLRELGREAHNQTLLIESGMLVAREDGKCYDRFRDRIMFPIHDSRGRVIAFGGRVLGDDKPKYLNSPETDIFHKGRELYGLYQARQAERHLQRLLIVEGYMDVVALAQHGIRNAVATLGTATTTEHLHRVFRHCAEVVFCFDGDEAGRRAARRALETALPALEDGRQARFLFLPEGEDPDSLVRRIDAGGFNALLEGAAPLEDYLFDALSEDLDPGTLEGKARLSRRAAPLIQLLPEGVFRELMLESLAQRAGLGRQALQALLERQPPARPERPAAPRGPRHRDPLPQPPEGDSRDPLLPAIALLVHHPRSLALVDPAAWEALQSAPDDSPVLATLKELVALLQQRPESSTAMLLGHWQGQPEGEVLNRALRQEHPPAPDDEVAAEALREILNHLHHRRSRQQWRTLVDKLRNADYAQLSDTEKQQLKAPPRGTRGADPEPR
jgi:DNA primase